jgi:hypothetical protein
LRERYGLQQSLFWACPACVIIGNFSDNNRKCLFYAPFV